MRLIYLWLYTLASFLWCSGCGVVGYDKTGRYRYVQVDGTHASFKSLLHSLFHVLGRHHEHQRADREDYIRINHEYIIEGINNMYMYLYIFTLFSSAWIHNYKITHCHFPFCHVTFYMYIITLVVKLSQIATTEFRNLAGKTFGALMHKRTMVKIKTYPIAQNLYSNHSFFTTAHCWSLHTNLQYLWFYLHVLVCPCSHFTSTTSHHFKRNDYLSNNYTILQPLNYTLLPSAQYNSLITLLNIQYVSACRSTEEGECLHAFGLCVSL